MALARPLAGIIYLPTTGRAEEDDPSRPVYTPRSGRTTRSGPVRQDKVLSYGMFLSSPTVRTKIRGNSESPFLPVGSDTAGTGDRPLHSATSGYLLDLRHPVSRPDRRSRLSLPRDAPRYRTRTPLAQRLLPPQAHRTTSNRH